MVAVARRAVISVRAMSPAALCRILKGGGGGGGRRGGGLTGPRVVPQAHLYMWRTQRCNQYWYQRPSDSHQSAQNEPGGPATPSAWVDVRVRPVDGNVMYFSAKMHHLEDPKPLRPHGDPRHPWEASEERRDNKGTRGSSVSEGGSASGSPAAR